MTIKFKTTLPSTLLISGGREITLKPHRLVAARSFFALCEAWTSLRKKSFAAQPQTDAATESSQTDRQRR